MAPTAVDYLWFEQDFPDLAEAYCITLVHHLTPEELLDRLRADALPPLNGIEAIVDAAYDLEEGQQLVALLQISDWTLMVEPNGYLGVTDEQALPASAGTTWVSHFCNINGLDAFLWAEDCATRLTFEPIFPTHAGAPPRTASWPPCAASTSRSRTPKPTPPVQCQQPSRLWRRSPESSSRQSESEQPSTPAEPCTGTDDRTPGSLAGAAPEGRPVALDLSHVLRDRQQSSEGTGQGGSPQAQHVGGGNLHLGQDDPADQGHHGGGKSHHRHLKQAVVALGHVRRVVSHSDLQ